MTKKHPTAGRKPPEKADPGKRAGGRTQPVQSGGPAPRLPHERDQSSDSQQDHGRSAEQARKGMEDVERGVVDTDRGPPADRAYEKLKR